MIYREEKSVITIFKCLFHLTRLVFIWLFSNYLGFNQPNVIVKVGRRQYRAIKTAWWLIDLLMYE